WDCLQSGIHIREPRRRRIIPPDRSTYARCKLPAHAIAKRILREMIKGARCVWLPLTAMSGCECKPDRAQPSSDERLRMQARQAQPSTNERLRMQARAERERGSAKHQTTGRSHQVLDRL